MNWLTTQLAELHYFGDLARDSFATPDEGLRVLPFANLRDALRSAGVTIDAEVSLEPYILFVEDVESAAVRAERATPGRWEPLSPIFTLALDDGKGTVLYLPEDRSQRQDLQLFDLADEHISRIRADGAFDGTYAQILTVTAQRAIGCSDGPCKRWGDACGGGCECNKREVTSAIASALPVHFISGPGRTYTLVCE